jgi:amidohydrolase
MEERNVRLKGEQILAMAKDIEPEIINWRRTVHRYPELGMETPRTSEFIEDTLKSMGIEVKKAAGYGVVGTLRDSGHRTIAVRADIDALPVTEETGLPYASEVPGRMHACGHDAHVAIVLGTAKILSQLKGHLKGNVKFIFQPGEEGPGGAQPMIDDGALEDPAVDAIIGGHVGMLWPVESGRFGFKAGPIMAATDSFTITIKGKGGHGATPNQCIDPVVIAAQVVLSMQAIVSREVNPISPAVITIGKIEAGTRHNIIPQDCTMHGTVRYLDRAFERFIPKRIEEMVTGVSRAMRGDAVLEYRYGYRPLVNDPEITKLVKKAASSVAGSENVVDVAEPTMGGEDMSYYLEKVPGTFIAIGTGNKEKGTAYPNHHPKFTVDEDVLHVASGVFARACLDFLDEKD